jgi:hypothetical protein
MTRISSLLAGVAMTPMEQSAGRFMRAPDHPAAVEPVVTPPKDDSAYADAFAAAAAEPAPAAAEPPAATPPAAEPAPAAAAEPPAAATPPAATPPAATPPAEPAPAAGAEPPAGTPPVAPKAGETPPAEPAPAAAPAAAAPPAAPSAEDIVKGLTDALKAPGTPAAPGAPAAQETPQAPIFTEAEQAQLVAYEKDWPDVAAAEALRRKGEYHDLLGYVFKEVHAYYAPQIDALRAIQNRLHTQEVNSLVPDYSEDLEKNVATWVDSQPSYLQAPMKQVMQTGTSDEIADLIGRYREATGSAPAPKPAAPAAGAAAPAPAAAAPPKTELSSAAKQAAESLAPVSTERSAVPQGDDPGDYDSNFAKYAAELAST